MPDTSDIFRRGPSLGHLLPKIAIQKLISLNEYEFRAENRHENGTSYRVVERVDCDRRTYYLCPLLSIIIMNIIHVSITKAAGSE